MFDYTHARTCTARARARARVPRVTKLPRRCIATRVDSQPLGLPPILCCMDYLGRRCPLELSRSRGTFAMHRSDDGTSQRRRKGIRSLLEYYLIQHISLCRLCLSPNALCCSFIAVSLTLPINIRAAICASYIC